MPYLSFNQNNNTFDVINNKEFTGFTLFATSLYDKDCQREIPTLKVANSVWWIPFYDDFNKMDVEVVIQQFLKDFEIVVNEDERSHLITTLFNDLVQQKYHSESTEKFRLNL